MTRILFLIHIDLFSCFQVFLYFHYSNPAPVYRCLISVYFLFHHAVSFYDSNSFLNSYRSVFMLSSFSIFSLFKSCSSLQMFDISVFSFSSRCICFYKNNEKKLC